MTGVDFSRGGVSRYFQLATLFRRRIETGEWREGEQIPTIDELVEEFGVARATVRQALGLLDDENLIERHRAKGSFVKKREKEQLWSAVEVDLKGLLRPKDPARIEILSDVDDKRPTEFFHKIGEPVDRYKHMRRRHWRNDVPFLITDIYFAEDVFTKLNPKHFQVKTALQLVLDTPGINIPNVQQTLTINSADMDTARLLDIPLNHPMAFVRRTAADKEGRIVVIAEGHYRGDMVRLDLTLR